MNPLVLSGFGNFVSVDAHKLVVSNKIENTIREYQMHNLPFDNLIVDSNTGCISWAAIRFLIKHNVAITTLDWNGNLLSVTLPDAPASAKLRIKQYEAYLNRTKRYYIAHTIIKEKIKQSLNLLRELSKYYSEIDIKKIEASFDKENGFYNGNSISTLLTFEARVADIYFDSIIRVIQKLAPNFNFSRRNNSLNSHNRNAADPVNATLNYSYAILETEVRKDINTIGFDGSIGFLHELSDGRQSLIFDLIELARAPIADLSVIQLLEEKKLKASDFIVTENYNYRLRENTAKMLINKIKENMNQRYPYKGANYTYQNILFNEIRKLSNYLVGKQDELEFDIPLVQIKRNDELQLRDKIANMTIEERKAIGLRRNTLWHMQKNILAEKKIKVYNKVMTKLAN